MVRAYKTCNIKSAKFFIELKWGSFHTDRWTCVMHSLARDAVLVECCKHWWLWAES